MGADRRRLAERRLAALPGLERGAAADGRQLLPAGGGGIRRELLDLARRCSGAHGLGAHHASIAGRNEDHSVGAGPNPSDTTHDPDRLAAWSDFHREAESLPAEEREAFDLLFYQGLSQVEAAALLDVSERTIKRRWQSAGLRLVQRSGGEMAGL